MIKHLDGQNSTVKFDFICLEFVRMPGFYYINFVTGEGNIPGSPLLDFIRCLREGDKLNPGCKLLLATVGHKKAGYYDRWLPTKQSLETNFGKSREVEANANPYYKACVLVANRSETYNPVEQLKERNSNEKPFTEFTVLPDNALSSPFNFTDPLSEDHDEDSDADILLRNLINTYGHEEYSSFDVDAVHRDLLCNDGDEGSDFELEGSEDGDEESDCDSKTSTEDTLVGPSTENNRSDLQLLRKMVNAFGHEDSGFDVAAVNRDLCSEDGDEESDCDSQTSTEDTPVAPSTENDRNANEDIDIIDLTSEDDSDGAITTPKMTGAASAPQSTELSDGAITTPKMTGAASAPQPTELIQKVAQRIANGERYRTVCVALGFNLNENKEYKGCNTSDYSRLQHEVRKVKNEQNKHLAKMNVRLDEELEQAKLHLQYVTERCRVLQEKLDKCECGSSRKRKITTHLQPKKQSRTMIHS